MLFNKTNTNTLKTLVFNTKKTIFNSILIQTQKKPPPCTYTQSQTYVNVYMKWKKDSYFDSIERIHKSVELKPILALKNVIAQEPSCSIPISAISKRGLEFDIHIKVARFLRQYPSFFEEFTGPLYSLPWFKLTQEAIEIDREEKRVYEECRDDLRERLKRFVEMEDGLKGLAVENIGEEKVLSVLQRNAMKRGLYVGEPMEPIEFPFFPQKGLRLKRKIDHWFNDFQKVPYVSAYEDYSHLDPDSDVGEKRVVGFLHELLSLFVEHSAQRKKLLCLKKYFRLPQKVHRAFERHTHLFYLSLRNNTCTAILKEPFCDKYAIEEHPLARVREKYIKLLKQSKVILKTRRLKNQSDDQGNLGKDLDCEDEERRERADSSV
ncbi:hypothetical protein WN944_018539 [Citrus x changshan-huyou]|uniref:PORR domain-containing protein n=1 Tax=Citrus x changshan-huyou TaxID=2935761 RepID=A0AAP0LTM8_9ROSI